MSDAGQDAGQLKVGMCSRQGRDRRAGPFQSNDVSFIANPVAKISGVMDGLKKSVLVFGGLPEKRDGHVPAYPFFTGPTPRLFLHWTPPYPLKSAWEGKSS